ncbi:MAG: glucose-1-phosphate adenylyltransferase [Betaproteobacteria bacterium]|jgi:glucose-1-phosphate adenylyltransferase|nr:glucose-1-phosphate adenylyltransferase [Betaproteobacteria bacterium]
MIGQREVLAMVLAGGEGSRLQPLTAGRSKPAVPFSGGTRIVDYVLSNLINSRMYAIYLLVQYKSQSLIEHVHTSWSLSPVIPGQFITIVPPQMREGPTWFQGTADAIYQNLNLIEQHNPEVVAIFGADHVYRMDVRQMLAFHRERRADVTVAALPVPVERASAFGIIGTERDGRIREFLEKPEHPPAMPGRSGHAYASMGNYLFDAEVLKVALEEAREQGGTDFGRHMLPRLVGTRRLYAYDFATNTVPGVKPYEEAGYWRDVGSLDAYFEAHQDLLGTEPRFDAFNPYWPIQSGSYVGPVARILGGTIDNSMIASGSRIESAVVRNTVLRYDVRIDPGAVVEDCVIMDHVHVKRGARLRRVIVDRYNTIEEGERIGYDTSADARRFTVSPGGIVVVPRAQSGGVPFSPVFAPRTADPTRPALLQ